MTKTMHTYALNDYSLADVLFKSDTEAWGTGSANEGRMSQYSTAIRPHVDRNTHRLIKSSIMSMCLTFPQTQVNNDAFIYSYTGKSLICQMAEITDWAVSVTTPSLPELFLTGEQQDAPVVEFLQGVHFLNTEPDFMHLMPVSQFALNVGIQNIEEGEVRFYESDVINVIDEPFFI